MRLMIPNKTIVTSIVLCLCCSPPEQSLFEESTLPLFTVSRLLPACSSTEGDLNLWEATEWKQCRTMRGRAHGAYLRNMPTGCTLISFICTNGLEKKHFWAVWVKSHAFPALTFSQDRHIEKTHICRWNHFNEKLKETASKNFQDLSQSISMCLSQCAWSRTSCAKQFQLRLSANWSFAAKSQVKYSSGTALRNDTSRIWFKNTSWKLHKWCSELLRYSKAPRLSVS